MVKYVIRGVAVIGAGVLSFLLWNASRIPNFDDAAIAAALADGVRTAYGQFRPRAETDQTSQGKAIYEHPGAHGHPTLVIYEVTDPAERARIVAATKAALRPAHAQGATVQFYQQQNVTHYPGGGTRRGQEALLDTVQVAAGN